MSGLRDFRLLLLLERDRDREPELLRCSEPEREGEPDALRFLGGDSEEPERDLLGRERGGGELPREREREELEAEEEEERDREELESRGLSGGHGSGDGRRPGRSSGSPGLASAAGGS